MKTLKMLLGSFVVISCFWFAEANAQATDVDCDRCVDTSDIAIGAIRPALIENEAVNTPKLKDGAVTIRKLRDGAVSNSKLRDGAVTAAKIGASAVGVTQVDPSQVQLRVGGSCAVGNYIAAINEDGSVDCGAPSSTLGGLKVYAQGVEIGTFLAGAGFSLLDSKAFVVSDKGYVFMIGLDNDEYLDKGEVRFAGPGCTGDAILSWYQPYDRAWWVKFFGYVGDYGDGNLYYMPRPVSFVELQVMSGIYLVDYDSGTWSCVTSSETSTASGFLVLPNDETITGVSSTPFPGPYTIGVPE